MFVRTLTALALLSVPAVAEAADGGAQHDALKRYCTGDYLTYCGNLSPDGPEVQACFKANKASLSPNCQGAIAAYQKANRKGTKEALAR